MKNVNLRLPDDLHAAVREVADTDERSLNGQIIWLLKAGLAFSGEDVPGACQWRMCINTPTRTFTRDGDLYLVCDEHTPGDGQDGRPDYGWRLRP